MGEVVQFRPRPAPDVKDELAELVAWIKPASDWWTGRMQIELARHAYFAADYRRLLAGRQYGKEHATYIEARELAETTQLLWRTECLKQIFIPAEAVRHLRWKQDWLRRHGGGTPETALAIARDDAALVDRIELHKRQQAGRKANRATVL